MTVKLRAYDQFLLSLSLALLISALGIGACSADQKFIRLRNELIPTSAPDRTSKASVQAHLLDEAVSGLYLVQFNERFEASWREPLGSLGVELVRFVPEDAFVARLTQVSVSKLRALPFVRWVGEYRPALKVHTGLHQHMGGKDEAASVGVSLLFSPGTTPAELAKASGTFKKLRVQSKSSLGTVLCGAVSSRELGALARSDSVLWIEPAPRMRLNDEISSKIVAGGEIPESSGGGGDDDWFDDWFDVLGVGTNTNTRVGKLDAGEAPLVHSTLTQQLGYDGRGVVVAVADSGLHNGDAESMHPDLAGRVDAFYFYGPLLDAADEHSHGTHVTGIIAGDGSTGEMDYAGALYGLGVAPGAHIVAQRVFDADGQDELPDYETLTHDAVRAGAVIGSNSWGDDVQGRYDLSAAQFDALVRDADAETPGEQPYILEFSAGNAGPGPQTMDSPAVGKNVIATGASQNERYDFFIYADGQDTTADFSSRGPCEDGRIKPDLVAPGTWIASLQSESAGDYNAWSPISSYYQYQGGTSQAGPHVSGAAAVFVQYYRELHGNVTPSPALVKGALINSAVDMDDSFDTGPIPNFDEGWGRLALTNIIGSVRHFEYVDQTELLSTGETYERQIIVANSDEPLKITLTYTDVPGLPAALPALVNDLDLEVVGPDGRIYRGNQFIDGESVAGATGADNINNVEGVHLAEPPPGDYLIRVRARNVVEDIRHRGNVAPQQDFALVVSGILPIPGVGIVVFDRDYYTAPGAINVKVIDADLIGQPSVSVMVKSATEPNGEVITLLPLGSSGIFAGAIATSTGPVASDGRLQVREGDSIEASYQDVSPAAVGVATALADLTPPLISNVTVTNRFGKEIISWETDEPASAIVVYGTGPEPNLSATNLFLEFEHEVELQDLAEGGVYRFYVISADEAGNSATDDNGGQFYSFVAQPAATILLVDAYTPDDPLFQGTEVPLTTYTDALDQTGISYEVWDLTDPTLPSPGADDLKPFRVVIWRISDSLLGTSTLSPPQQSAIATYVGSGGSLFMSSMELLTRLGPSSSFRTNVLQVVAFEEDVGVPEVYGADNDPVSSGMVLPLDYSAYDNEFLQLIGQSPDVADTLTITTNAAPIFFDFSSDRIAGLRSPRSGQDSAGRVVFLSFPFDAAPEAGTSPNTRAALMRNVLLFLAPGLGGLGTVTLDRAAYTLPDLITIEVGDSDLAGEGRATVTCFSSSMTNGITVDLPETARKGLFRGAVRLGSAAAAGAVGQLSAQAGDSIWAEYLDASSSSVVSARAIVDIEAPVISDIEVFPEYEEAFVSWITSEPTDALVQFGESTFLGRTAYSQELAEAHELTLTGLQPDRLYYYQVVSRDNAGNTVIDDNDGELYTFRTLKPLSAPWTDDLDSPDTEASWSVESGPESMAAWALGVPNNELQFEALSPPNAWGSNLEGWGVDVADTTLVGPAIHLSGGNSATLRFWHSYDFQERSDMDIYEYGQLYISTNTSAAWVLLEEYGDLSAAWEEEVIDLTPYLGRVVQLGWYYGLFSLEGSPRPGWMIDNVSVTVTNLVLGSIQVSNNLAQATFSLSGPVARNGQGASATFTNMPTGEYIATFGDVPFYETPPPQTKVVSDKGTVVFEGVYTFTDSNDNGIADSWEEQFFGAASPSHPAATDTDGDGFNDQAEFISGTDPTDPTSNLQLLTPTVTSDATFRLTWQSAPGHNYRLLSSTNAISWTPLTSWIRAGGAQAGPLSFNIPLTNLVTARFFRLQTTP